MTSMVDQYEKLADIGNGKYCSCNNDLQDLLEKYVKSNAKVMER